MMLGWLALALFALAAVALAVFRLAGRLRPGGGALCRAPDLLATLDCIEQGVSVVDARMRLVAWNRQYQRLFDYPEGLLQVGRPVADVIRFNARRGKFGSGPGLDIEAVVRKRVGFMRAGTVHRSQRTLRSGRVLELRGRPLPRGGYVTSYSDITEFKRVQLQLRDIHDTFERRVSARTRQAEAAQQSRTQFLTAISHDVLQPINAARLFASALDEEQEPEAQRYLAGRINTSLRAAEELLDGLLDVSRLNAGMLQPEPIDFDIEPMLRELADQYGHVALRAGLQLRLHARRPLPVRSDPRLLRRVLQNFLANALRYTRSGRILLSARSCRGHVRLQVWDTGPGIAPQQLRYVYDEFHRDAQGQGEQARGHGLGLSICRRFASLLGHPLDARSAIGRGSVFSISVPRSQPRSQSRSRIRSQSQTDALTQQCPHRPAPDDEPPVEPASLQGLRVLCLDNDADVLGGMQALLSRWQASVLCAATLDDALLMMRHQPHVLLVDYHLRDRLDGLDSLDALRAAAPSVRGALLSVDGDGALRQAARLRGYRVLAKPVKPASLRAFLAAKLRAQAAFKP
ncbi:ATP-binding response regulator [Achromobacter sp. AGC39]